MTVRETPVASAGAQLVLIAGSTAVVAAAYGLVRLAYGLMLPDVQAELGLDTDTAGLISSGASIIYCVAALIGLFFASRNAKALMVGAAVTAGFGAIGMALAPNTAVFAIFAILSSTGSGFASPAIVDILQRNVAAKRVDQAQMIASAGAGPGLIAAAVLALLLLPNWRLAWGISGVIMLLVCALVIAYDRARVERIGASQTLLNAPWFRAHVLVFAAALLIGIGSGTVWTYGRNLVVDAGASDLVSVLAWIALGVGGTVVIFTARWTDRLRPRSAWTVAALVTGAATAALAVLPTVPALELVAFAVFGWGYLVCCGTLIVWTVQIDAARAPAGAALLFVVLIFGQAVGASMAGFIAVSAGYLAAFLVAAAVSLIAGLVVYAERDGR